MPGGDGDDGRGSRDEGAGPADRDGDGRHDSRDDLTVRRADPGDRPRIRELHRSALRAAGTDPDDVPGTEDLRNIESSYVEPGGEFLVAEVDGRIVAIGGLTVEGEELAPGEGELLRIAVDPEHHRQGYGSAIVDGLEAAARERDLDRIVLTTARRQSAATEFYPARGYAEVGRESTGEYELIEFAKRLD